MQDFLLSADNKLDGPSNHSSRECCVHDLQKEFQILVSDYRTIEQFSALPQSILKGVWLRENGSFSRSCKKIETVCAFFVA